jgi:hypothetical protein
LGQIKGVPANIELSLVATDHRLSCQSMVSGADVQELPQFGALRLPQGIS